MLPCTRNAQTTEHAPLGDPLLVVEQGTEPTGEILVVRHSRSLARTADSIEGGDRPFGPS
jgi:hypothetical protein